jgi:hypothetical protein
MLLGILKRKYMKKFIVMAALAVMAMGSVQVHAQEAEGHCDRQSKGKCKPVVDEEPILLQIQAEMEAQAEAANQLAAEDKCMRDKCPPGVPPMVQAEIVAKPEIQLAAEDPCERKYDKCPIKRPPIV